MFYSTFGLIVGEVLEPQKRVQMLLPVDFLDLIQTKVEAHRGVEPLVFDLHGCLMMESGTLLSGYLLWEQGAGHFAVVVDDAQVGVIVLDELLGSMRHQYNAQALECRVGLYRDGSYVWRRGMLDLKTGDVAVYTNLSQLDYAPAIAVLASSSMAGEDLIVELLPGPASTRPLHAHGVQRDWLRAELAPMHQPIVMGQDDALEPFSICGQHNDQLRSLFEGDPR